MCLNRLNMYKQKHFVGRHACSPCSQNLGSRLCIDSQPRLQISWASRSRKNCCVSMTHSFCTDTSQRSEKQRTESASAHISTPADAVFCKLGSQNRHQRLLLAWPSCAGVCPTSMLSRQGSRSDVCVQARTRLGAVDRGNQS